MAVGDKATSIEHGVVFPSSRSWRGDHCRLLVCDYGELFANLSSRRGDCVYPFVGREVAGSGLLRRDRNELVAGGSEVESIMYVRSSMATWTSADVNMRPISSYAFFCDDL